MVFGGADQPYDSGLMRKCSEDNPAMNSSHKLTQETGPLDRLDVLPVTLILALAVVAFFARFVGLGAENPYSYDEGAYYAAAIRMAGGERPYQDFLYVQPPGLPTLTAFGLLARMTLSSQRAVHAVSGLALAAVVFLLARCATRRPHAPAMATLFLVSSPLFFALTRMVMTDPPAATLTAGAALAVMSCMRGGIFLCGMLVAAGSLFRLQGVFLVPFLLPLAAVTRGSRDTFRLAALCAALTAVAQGLIWLAWPHYIADAVLLHRLRPSFSILERYRTVEAVLADITFATGLLGASALLMSGCPRKAAFGALTLCGFLETTILFNSLFTRYFLMILPFASVCAALLVSDATASYGRWALPLAAAFVFAVQAPHMEGNIAGPVGEARDARGVIEEVRRHPGRILLTTDPGFAPLCGKRLPSTHDASDPFAASLAGRFSEFIETALPESDLVLVTNRMVASAAPGDVERITRSKKPVVFATPTLRRAWETKGQGSSCGPD